MIHRMSSVKSFLIGFALCSVLVVSCAWTAPNSWTLRKDGRIRASQRDENFSIEDFLDKIKSEENQDYSIVLTPAGAKAIADELAYRSAKITELENKLKECR